MSLTEPWVGLALAAAVPLALAVDRLWGEPPSAVHPVVWMGRYLAWTGHRLAPREGEGTDPEGRRDLPRLLGGALLWCGGAALCAGLAVGLQAWAAQQPVWLAALVLGLALKPLLAWRLLGDEVQAVEDALADSLPAGRARLAWLVSRDVSQLGPHQVRESAIESLAENLNDSVVAPLFWFAVAGLPGAALYRFANTADAMWGYPGWRGGPGRRHYWAWAGKWAARADDVLSWVPARLTALLLALPARLPWRSLRTEAGKTPSPNSGWPMAAMALRLGVRLGKPGAYVLNPQAPSPGTLHTQRALALAGSAVAWATALSGGALALAAAWPWSVGGGA